jgi:hypothetical protein
MTPANSNEGLNEAEILVENVLDDLLDEAEKDGPDGPLDPGALLVEMAARALSRAVLDHDMMPDEARDYMARRMTTILNEAVDRSTATMAPDLRVVR